MNIEYEATFADIDKELMRQKLTGAGAVLMKPEFLQKRVIFALPEGNKIVGGYARVRDEGDKITMSLKVIDGDRIENQKEICLTVDSFGQGKLLLATLGCKEKAYQETKRELWMLDCVEIMIDEWPFLDSFVEIEGKSEEVVKAVAEKLGFDYSQAIFGAVDVVYMRKYPHLTADRINNHIPRIVFDSVQQDAKEGKRTARFTDMYKSPLSYKEASAAIMKFAISDYCGIVHACGQRMSIYDLTREGMEALGISTEHLVRDSIPKERIMEFLPDTSFDNSLMRELIGMTPMSIKEGISL